MSNRGGVNSQRSYAYQDDKIVETHAYLRHYRDGVNSQKGIRMTELGNEGGNSSSNFAPAPVNSSPTPAQSAPIETERSFKQSEVNDLVGRAKSEAVERYKRESSMASHSQSQPVPQQPYNTAQQVPQGYTNQPMQQQPQMQQGTSEDRVRQLAAETTQKLREQWTEEARNQAEEEQAKAMAKEFFTKIDAGKANLPDFDKVIADSQVDFRHIPYHVQLANMCENTAEIMYDLAKNPSKIGQIQNLIDIDLRAGRQPKLALTEMKKLASSIKENGTASNFKAPNEPLSQLRPSSAGTGKQGPLSVGDYRRKYKV
jgi:hypothetical protein